MLRRAKHPRRRSGFTLIELLVVIAIISVLVSLTAVGVFRLIGVQQKANTNAELTRVEGEFLKKWAAAADKFQREPLPPPTGTPFYNAYLTVLQMAGGPSDPNQKERARVIWVKLRLKQTFPNNFAEAVNPAPLPPDAHYVNALKTMGYDLTKPLPATQPWESSACLLLALTRGEDGIVLTVENLGVSSSITNQPLPAPYTGTAQVLVDGWHNPLAFCRWPTGSTHLGNTAAGQAGYNDPGDSQGLLTNGPWLIAQSANFATYCHALPARQGYTSATSPGTAMSYRISPLIASPGPDGKLGLDLNTFAPLPGNDANDNLYAALATP